MGKRNLIRKTSSNEGLDNLYISFSNSDEKRKNLLYGIKNSLVMQDEFEKVQQLRGDKATTISNIKKNLVSLNSNYQKLKKLLPNVKNILSYTEKELGALDEQIDVLNSSIIKDKSRVKDLENFEEDIKLKAGLTKPKKISKVEVKKVVKTKIKKVVKVEDKKPLTKLDRIKNNLKVIESKLNNI